eukprot:NODE_1130_length_1088_cov_83.394610_g871_i1.p1 GENE.NODE_1130_length_1088_cov_83.394610_g871_i1~~NODE_1130_length_1088_cov_83.394610_g871_i1.p1  ORF type:complete len:330 (-),score=44.02 NODE_1130_length_1088_cov_83.394610_g871_i1:4-993(-)
MGFKNNTDESSDESSSGVEDSDDNETCDNKYLIQWESSDLPPDYVELGMEDRTKDPTVEDRWHRLYPPYLEPGTRIDLLISNTHNEASIVRHVPEYPSASPHYEVCWENQKRKNSVVNLTAENEEGSGNFCWKHLDSPVLRKGDRVAVWYQEGYWDGLIVETPSTGDDRAKQPNELKVELILGRKRENDVALFLTKFVGLAYLKAEWHTYQELQALGAAVKVDNWVKKHGYEYEPDDDQEREYFNPIFTEVDRIVDHVGVEENIKYLVKWKGLSYDECTWEDPADVDAPTKIAQYHNWQQFPTKQERRMPSVQELMAPKKKKKKKKTLR